MKKIFFEAILRITRVIANSEAALDPSEATDCLSPRRISAWQRSVKQAEVLSFPSHSRLNARPPARMIEKHKFFNGTRIKLPVFPKEKVCFSFAVGLPGSIQAEDVGFKLLCPGESVA